MSTVPENRAELSRDRYQWGYRWIECSPAITPHSKYLFLQSCAASPVGIGKPLTFAALKDCCQSPENGSTNVYWVDARIIEDLRSRQPLNK